VWKNNGLEGSAPHPLDVPKVKSITFPILNVRSYVQVLRPHRPVAAAAVDLGWRIAERAHEDVDGVEGVFMLGVYVVLQEKVSRNHFTESHLVPMIAIRPSWM